MDRMRDKKALPETSEHTWFPWRESEVNDEAHQDYLIRVLADWDKTSWIKYTTFSKAESIFFSLVLF